MKKEKITQEKLDDLIIEKLEDFYFSEYESEEERVLYSKKLHENIKTLKNLYVVQNENN